MSGTLPDLRYPIGPFQAPDAVSDADRRGFITRIAKTPSAMRAAIAGLDEGRLETPYRPGGWTVRQLTHHVPDSHLNAYVRFRLALTEQEPLIRTYDEKAWAELPDTRTAPVGMSLDLLDALHQRWVAMLSLLPPTDFGRTLLHPEIGVVSLNTMLALYAWHGEHHVAHVTSLRVREGWT